MPSSELAANIIHHHSEIAIVLAHLQVGNVTDPDLIRSLELNLTRPIGNGSMKALHRHPAVAPRRHPGFNAVRAHQPGDPVLSHLDAAILQLTIHARATIGAAAVLMHTLDLMFERYVLLRSCAY